MAALQQWQDVTLMPVWRLWLPGVNRSHEMKGNFWQAEPDVPSVSPRSMHICMYVFVSARVSGEMSNGKSRWLSQSNVRSHETTHAHIIRTVTHILPRHPHPLLPLLSKKATCLHNPCLLTMHLLPQIHNTGQVIPCGAHLVIMVSTGLCGVCRPDDSCHCHQRPVTRH